MDNHRSNVMSTRRNRLLAGLAVVALAVAPVAVVEGAAGADGGGPNFTSAASTSFTENQSGSFTVTTTGDSPISLVESGALPTGVTFVDNGDDTATLSGTPAFTTAGTYPIQITATDAATNQTEQDFTLTVLAGPPVITSAGAATYTVGTLGSFTVTTVGDPPISLGEAGALPTGVSFVDNGDGTAALSGVPAAATGGIYPFTITATDANANTANQ